MFENTRLKSPSQCGSRKAYDYLNDNNAAISASNDKFRSDSKPLRVNDLSPISKQPTQYELIVQFQLRRQKQKNLILQQRLRNKQSFIKQMKQFQDQLTIAFEKCQQQLHYFKSQCLEYESRWNSFATFNDGIVQNNGNGLNNNINIDTINNSLGQQQQKIQSQNVGEQLIREYVEQIAELKHLVIRLQEEIVFYQKRQKMYKQNNKNMSSSVKNQFFPHEFKNDKKKSNDNNSRLREIQSRNMTHNDEVEQRQSLNNNKQNKHFKPLESQKRQQRSKTLANQFVEQKKQQNFTTLNKISQFINSQTRKISSFLNHFLTMCEFFQQSIEKQPSVKHKLKKAWKWIKTAMAQWNYLKKQKLQKVKEYKIGNIVTKLLPLTTNLSIQEIQTLLQKILRPTLKQQKAKKVY